MTYDKPHPEDPEEESLETVEQDDSDEAEIQDDIAADAEDANDDAP